MSDEVLNSANCRAARGLLGWSARELAEKAGASRVTVARFEAGGSISDGVRDKIAAAFDAAGVELFNSDRPGARLR